jgi:hypothetical protein
VVRTVAERAVAAKSVAEAIADGSLEIANPESAARVMGPGENLRAFLIDGATENKTLRVLSRPFLLWVESSPVPHGAWASGFQCPCQIAFRVSTQSIKEYNNSRPGRQAWGESGYPPSVCLCMGRFIE